MLRYEPTCLPSILNEDSKAIVVIRIVKMSLAMEFKMGYLIPFIFHQANISKSIDLCNIDSSKYYSNSDFILSVVDVTLTNKSKLDNG